MKTVQQGEAIIRVKDDTAAKLVKQGWKYVPKQLWKERVRDKGKVVAA